MQRPPWYLLKSPWLNQLEISQALCYAEERWGREGLAPIAPDLDNAHTVGALAELEKLLAKPAALERRFTLVLPADLVRSGQNCQWICKLAATWRKSSPFSEVCLVLQLSAHSATVPSEANLRELQQSFLGPDHLLERIRYFYQDSQGLWSCRLFVMANSPEACRRWLQQEHQDTADLIVDLANSTQRQKLVNFLVNDDWERWPFVHAGSHIETPLSEWYQGLENLLI